MDTNGRSLRTQVGQPVWRMLRLRRQSDERSKDLGRGFSVFGRSGDTNAPDLAGILKDCGIGRRMATESASVSRNVPRETPRTVSPDSKTGVTGTNGSRTRPSNPSRDQIKAEYEQLKYHAARSIWKKRNRKTPSGVRTWAEWFEDKFKISLYDFAQEQKRKVSRSD